LTASFFWAEVVGTSARAVVHGNGPTVTSF